MPPVKPPPPPLVFGFSSGKCQQSILFLVTRLSEICLTWLIALFLNFPLMIGNVPLLFSHSKSIRMSTLITVIITYYLLIINYYYHNSYKKSQ